MKKITLQLISAAFLLLICNTNLFGQIGFTADQNQGCGPLTVTFTNTSPGPDVYQFYWYFNDGSPMLVDTLTSGQTTTHTYTSPGNYYTSADVFNLTTSNYMGYISGNNIQVDGVSIGSPDSTCVNDVVNFYANSNNQLNIVSWDFGDGNSSTQQYPQHTYLLTGNYTVTLVANTFSCGQQTVTKTIYVNTSSYPQPYFWENPNPACPNSQINFNSNSSYSTYTWNFGDGSSSNLDSPIHSYPVTGNYYVTLTVTNGCGNSGTSSDTVRVSTTVGFPGGMGMGNPSNVCPNEQVNCYIYSNSIYPKYVWDFGDGTPKDSTGSNIYHTFGNTYATYTISCKITNDCGADSTFQNTVTVSNYAPFPNQPWFSFQVNSPACPNSNVNFNAPNGYSNYQWDFGDGTPVTSTTDGYNNHNYGSALTSYAVSVKITNLCGNDTTLYDTLHINNNVHFPNQGGMNLQVNSSPACPNSDVGFDAPGGYNNYQWDFGDGSPLVTTTNNYNNHLFGSAITAYSVSVKITNTCGNDTTLFATVQINNAVHFPNQSWFNLQTNSSVSCPNTSINFNAPNGYSNYQWNFGDASPIVTTNDSYNNHAFGSTQGTYTVSVKITNNCGNDTTLYNTIQIDSNAYFQNESWFTLQVNSPSYCPNSSVNFYVPGNYDNYLWNFGDGTPQVTSTYGNYNHLYGSTTGSYTASVTITNGCGNDTTLYTTIQILNNLSFPNQSWFQLSGPNTACPNDQMNWNAPDGYTNYQWSFGDGDSVLSTNGYANHTYATTGTYFASVKITNNCGNDTTLYASIIVDSTGSFPSWLQINASPSASCPNDLIAFYVNQNNFQSYVWDFGDGQTATSTGDNIQHAYDTLGNYFVSCQVTNGCGNTTTITTTVQVTGNSPVNSTVSVEGMPNPSCPNDEVFFLIKEGQSNYTYIWNYGDGSPVDTTVGTGSHHVYSSIGVYTVTTTVINGCGSSKILTMTETISSGIFPTLTNSEGYKNWGFPGSESNGTTSTAGCLGDAIIFYYMGASANNVWDFGDGSTGTATESMLIYGGNGSFPITIIKHAYAANGTYLVSLTITNGCGNSVTDTMTIKIGGNQTVNGDLTTSPPPFTTCASIDFLAFGGSTYGWDFGDGNTISTSSPTVSHTFASQGVYVVSVLVTNGCGNTATYSMSVNVNGVGGPAVILSSSTPPTCIDGANGSATISVTNGQPPYLYSWNDAGGQTSETANGLLPGLYNATVTDNIGCATTLAVSIANPAPIILNVSTTNTGCGTATGTAIVSVTSGGSVPFTYLWSTGATNSTETALAVGAYSVVATDNAGCTSNANVSISESGGAVLSVNTLTNNLCYGSSNGAIDMNVAGGTPPYTYVWSNGATTQDPTGLAPGNYSVQVTDNSGCKATLNAIISQPNDIVVATSSVHSPTCGPPPFDGSAKATPSGGTAPYTYLWDANAASQTTQTATALPAGTYTVTVTDSKGCSKDGVISLNNSNAPVISAVVTDVSCFGGSNGGINITVTGGTSAYSYNWNVPSPQTYHEDVNSLIPGNYFIFLTDAQGCMSFGTYTISQPTLLTTTVTNTSATCSNNDGTATANSTGGNTPYAYSWSGSGQSTQTATGLAQGNYTVTVTDNKGCIATGNTSIGATTLSTNICMVSVDPLSTHNVIYWEKPAVTNIDSFKVYREDVTSIYKHIGSVPYDSLSEYHDFSVDPNTTTKRYKISTLDNCGQESVKSDYHNTIYIVDNGLGQFTWNPLYTIENTANPVSNYVLMRDDNYTGSWSQVAITAGTQNTLVDTDYGLYPNGQWRVETAWGISCTPIRATINTTRSNIKGMAVSIGVDNALSSAISIYPNPAKDNVTIEFSSLSKNAQLNIINVLGQKVYSENLMASPAKTVKQINTSNFSKGIYTIVIETEKEKVYKKLIVN